MRVKMLKTYAGPLGAYNEGDVLELDKGVAKEILDADAGIKVGDEWPVTNFVVPPTAIDPPDRAAYVGPAPDLAARIPRTEDPAITAAKALAAKPASEVKPPPSDAPAYLPTEAMVSDDEARLKGMADQVVAGDTEHATAAEADAKAQSDTAKKAKK